MKALEKDRARRYETASALAADLQHYLNDEPVIACPPSAAYRFRKFARRNKLAIVTTAIVAASLVLGLLATTWQAVRATTAERKARQERDQKDIARREALASAGRAIAAAQAERQAKEDEASQRRRAEDNAKLAMAVLDEIVMQEARQRVAHVIQDTAPGPANVPVRGKQERDFLQKGMRFYEKLAETNATDWTARRERARAYANVGLLRWDLRDYAESEKAFRQAVQLLEQLAREKPSDFENRFDLANTYHWLYRPYWDTDRLQPAEELTRDALALFEKMDADFPDRQWQAQDGIARCHQNLAGVLKKVGKLQEAEKHYRAAVAYFEKRIAAEPSTLAAYRINLVWGYGGLTETLVDLGEHVEAAKCAEKLLAKSSDDGREYSRAALVLGRCMLLADKDSKLSEMDRKDVGQAYANRARELMQEAANQIADDAAAQNELAWQMATHPDPQLHDPAQAVALATQAVEREPAQGMYWNTLGTAQYRAGNWSAAIEALRKSSQMHQGKYFGHDTFVLAMALWQSGHKDEARKWYALAVLWMDKHAPDNEELRRFRTEAAALLDPSEPPLPGERQGPADDREIADLILEVDPSAAWAYRDRGGSYAEIGQWERAIADFAKAVELKPDDPASWNREALVHLATGDLTGYRRICTNCMERFSKTDDPSTAYWVAWTCVLVADAVPEPARLVSLAEKSTAGAATNYDYRNTLGAALYRAGRIEDAAKSLDEAAAVYQANAGFRQPLAYNWFFLAMAHHRRGQTDQAHQWLDKAVEWMDAACQEQAEAAATSSPMPWNRRLTLKLLREEAEALLKSPPGSAPGSEKPKAAPPAKEKAI